MSRRSTRCPHGFERAAVPCEQCGDTYNISKKGVVHISRRKPARVRKHEQTPDERTSTAYDPKDFSE